MKMSKHIIHIFIQNRIGGVMVSMLALSTVDRGFKPWSGQTKDYKIGICHFYYATDAVLFKREI
jgi:hypothetical protein